MFFKKKCINQRFLFLTLYNLESPEKLYIRGFNLECGVGRGNGYKVGVDGRLKVHAWNYFGIFYSSELTLCRMVERCIPRNSMFFCFSILTVFGEKMTSQD